MRTENGLNVIRVDEKKLVMCQNIIVRLQVAVGTLPEHGVNNLFQILKVYWYINILSGYFLPERTVTIHF